MSTGVNTIKPVTKTVVMSTDLSAKTYYLVNLTTTDNEVALATDSSKVPFVLLEGTDGSVTASLGTIAVGGTVKVKVGGTVAAGDKLTSNGSGLAITTTTNTQHYGLIALHAGSANDIIEALVAPAVVAA